MPASDDRERELMEGYSRICRLSPTISRGIMILMSVDAELKSEGSGCRCDSQLMSYSPMTRSRAAGLGGEVSIVVAEVRADCCR